MFTTFFTFPICFVPFIGATKRIKKKCSFKRSFSLSLFLSPMKHCVNVKYVCFAQHSWVSVYFVIRQDSLSIVELLVSKYFSCIAWETQLTKLKLDKLHSLHIFCAVLHFICNGKTETIEPYQSLFSFFAFQMVFFYLSKFFDIDKNVKLRRNNTYNKHTVMIQSDYRKFATNS